MRAAPRTTDGLNLSRWLPSLERLEAREVPAVTAALSQVATWAELGPNVTSNGQTVGITSPNPNGGAAVSNPVIGAISALTPHPTNPNIMFAGAPNGGVWRTTNAQDPSPTWTPLTDQLASMSVADITFDALNLNRVVVGIGATADGGEVEPSGTVRGDRIGLLVSDNALAAVPTWRIVGGPLAGRDVVKVGVRGAIWTVATTSGMYVSIDNGVTFTNTLLSSINNGLTQQPRPFTSRVYDLALNPRLLNQMYIATEPFAGLGRQVWRSDDFGYTWGTVTDPQMQLSTNTTSVKLSVRDTASNDNQVYVATVNTLPVPVDQRFLPVANTVFAWENRNNVLSSLCWSTNQGGNWTRMDQPRRMTAPEGLDLGQRRDGDTYQGGGLRADNGRVLVVTDEVRNNFQFGDGFPHRLQTGDLVFVRGVVEFPLTVPPATPPTNPIFDRGQGAFYFVEVRDSYSFWLQGAAAPSELMDSRQVFWQRTEDATAGEAGFMDIVAAPSNTAVPNALENLIYLGGDFSQYRFAAAGTPSVAGIGGPFPSTFTGSIWQGDRFVVPPNQGNTSAQWANFTGAGAANTAPGGDTREMVFDASGNLWVATGTGVYRRSTAANQPWANASGNIRVGQFWGVGYDSRNNLAVGATQDTGMVEQVTTGGLGFQSVLTRNSVIVRDPALFPNIPAFDVNAANPAQRATDEIRNFYTDQQYAYEVAVDNTSDPTRSIRYFASSTFGQLNQAGFANSFVPGVIRRVYDTSGNLLQTSALRFGNALTTDQPLSGLSPADRSLSAITNGRMDSSARIVMELNTNDARRGAYGQSRVYEDSDPLGPGSSPETGYVVSDVTPAGMTGRVRAMAYGGKRAGISFNQVMFVGTTTGQLFIRGEFGPTFNQVAPGTGEVTDILLDPDDYRHAFVAQGGQVYETRDLGASWITVSAGLVAPPDPTTGLPSNGALTTQIYTIALFDPNPGTPNVGTTGDVVLLAGGRGGVFRRTLSVCGTSSVWSEYGNGLPNSVVTDLEVVGSRLVAGTFGRGVWTIPDVTPTLTQTLFLDIIGDAGNNSITVQADPLDPNAILVFDGFTQLGRFSFGQFDAVRISALGGADTIRIGNGTNTRFVNYPVIANPGGDVGDALVIDSSGSTANVQATVDPQYIGRGAGDNIFSGCGSVTYIGLQQGTLFVLTGSGSDLVAFTNGTFPPVSAVYTGAGDDFLLVDGNSTGIIQWNDISGTDTLVMNVPSNVTAVVDSPNRAIGVGSRFVGYGAAIESVVLHGNTNSHVNWFGSSLNDTVFLAQDASLPGGSQLFTSTGAPGSAQNIRFRSMSSLTLNTGAAADLLIVDSNATGPGGSTKWLDLPVVANMGGDVGDSIAVNDSSTAAPTRATVFGGSVGALAGTDNLFAPGGGLFFTGLTAGLLRLETGSANDTVVFDTSAALAVNWNGNGGGNEGVLIGTGGNEVFAANGGTLSVNALLVSTTNVGTLTAVGAGGSDFLGVLGTAGSETLVLNQSGLQSGLVAGLPVQFKFDTLEWVNVDAAGGSNTLLWNDTSNAIYGTPSAPTSGIVFAPTGAVSGVIRTAGGAGTLATFNNVNGDFWMNGDPFGTNTRDVITVLGVSTNGLATDGELSAANGSDTILPSDAQVSITNASLGQLRAVGFAAVPNNSSSSFSTVYVKGGNEGGTGDTFNATPTLRTNLLLDGGDPSAAPGDTLTITTNGPASTASVNDPSLGPPHTRVTNRSDRASVGHLNFETVTAVTADPNNPGGPPVPSFGSAKADAFAVGSNGGIAATVQVYNLDGSLRFTLNPFGGFSGGVTVAVGDVTGDGKSDVIVGAGSGGGPQVNVYNGQTGGLERAFYAYDEGFTGGVTVAAGNLNSDRFADIITGAASGGGPHVKAFDGATNGELASFFAYEGTFTGGVNVAAGDVNGDGTSDIVTGTRTGSSLVRVFDGTNGANIRNLYGFDPAFTGGVSVAAGDLSGDGLADIFVGAGFGGGPHVRVFDSNGTTELRSFFVNDPNVPGAPPVTVSGGVNVAAGDFDNDGLFEMITGRGPGTRPFVQVFKLASGGLPEQTTLLAINTFGDPYANGISVGG